LPLFSVIAPATKHRLIQMIMTRNTTASMSEVNHTGSGMYSGYAQHPDAAMIFARSDFVNVHRPLAYRLVRCVR
jgi:hypothetical protein